MKQSLKLITALFLVTPTVFAAEGDPAVEEQQVNRIVGPLLVSHGPVSIETTGSLHITPTSIISDGALSITAEQTISNLAGIISAGGNLTISGGVFHNSGGSISAQNIEINTSYMGSD